MAILRQSQTNSESEKGHSQFQKGPVGVERDQYQLIASGEIDDTMLEALDSYVQRQRKRLGIDPRRADTEPAAARATGRKPPE